MFNDDLFEKNLSQSELSEANLDGILREDYYGIENVPAKYIKEED